VHDYERERRGIALRPETRGRGYGTQAQRPLARYQFAHTTVHRSWGADEIQLEILSRELSP
jgi:RimJ/RimL family protein N-acetyltransferase